MSTKKRNYQIFLFYVSNENRVLSLHRKHTRSILEPYTLPSNIFVEQATEPCDPNFNLVDLDKLTGTTDKICENVGTQKNQRNPESD